MQTTVTQHLSQDPVLKNLVDKIAFRELSINSKGVYLDLLSSIISQQLSTKVANVIAGRFRTLFTNENPQPHLLLEKDIDTLRSVGLSRQKAAYLQNVADFFQRENLLEKDWSDILAIIDTQSLTLDDPEFSATVLKHGGENAIARIADHLAR